MSEIRINFSQGNVLLQQMLNDCKTKKDIKEIITLFAPFDTKKRLNMVIKRYEEITGKKLMKGGE
jgi:hypothetical protein